MAEHEYSLSYLPAARRDTVEIVSSFVMLGSQDGASRIKNKFKNAAEQIQFMPYIGASVHDEKMAKAGVRMYVVEKYLMLYKVFEDNKAVLIYRILNGKTDYPTLMNRLYS